jgi:DNA invertase Pin-like site-specific DNA recombinase
MQCTSKQRKSLFGDLHKLLQWLLSDVEAGKIDVIVVYKVDRLTRSLADFAKLVELHTDLVSPSA